jgi:hypothetical protein
MSHKPAKTRVRKKDLTPIGSGPGGTFSSRWIQKYHAYIERLGFELGKPFNI